ncbi:MAG: hypothetical protein WED34_05530 [Planctomycetales bacterium]
MIRRLPILHCVALSLLCGTSGFADDMADEFRIRRSEPFEFAEKPAVAIDEGRVTIRFKARALCDATVAIEHGKRGIVRHLASGLLGPNAPQPFQKDSLEQAIVWDGKDERGRYVDDLDRVVVRVSLGLKARFERQFLWTPHRRISTQGGYANTHQAVPAFCAQPEGVYLFDGKMYDHLRLFDHEGKYVRTIHPFPAEKVEALKGVETHVFPQSGETLPLRKGTYGTTLLTSGTSYGGGKGQGELRGVAATAMAVESGHIALICNTLNRLATDGSTAGLPLGGPEVKIGNKLPRSAAFSPDGRTLYVTGFSEETNFPNWVLHWEHGVGRIDFAAGEKLEAFSGSLSGGHANAGSEPGKFKTPTSLDVDAEGRVYVADHFNDRVQVFDSEGTQLKSIPVTRPSEVCVDRRSGEIYVFTWYVDDFAFRRNDKRNPPVPKLTHFGPLDRPEVLGEYALPISEVHQRFGVYGGDAIQGRQFRAMVDSWAPGDTPTIWMIRWVSGKGGSIADGSPLVLRPDPESKKLVVVRDFAEAALERLPRLTWSGHGKDRLHVRPTTGELYVMATDGVLTIIDPRTGRMRTDELPFSPDDMAFDYDGHVYLRTHTEIVRYDPESWREVPFDYGEERHRVGLWNGRKGGPILAALPIDTPNIHHQGGIWVSPTGRFVVSFILGKVDAGSGDKQRQQQIEEAMRGWKGGWKPRNFPGRGGHTIVRVYDPHGKLLHDDAVRGIGYTDGVFLDRDGALYVTSAATRAGYFDKLTGTLVKLKPESRILTTPSEIELGNLKPDREPDTNDGAIGKAWWENVDWFYGGIGFTGKDANASHACNCPNYRPTQDLFARTFVPETQHYTVAVLDKAGNVVMRIGQYGNVDDGIPAVRDPAREVPHPRPLGGDEVGLFYPAYLATDSDRRLFITDPGNARILSVLLEYHAEERVPLR